MSEIARPPEIWNRKALDRALKAATGKGADAAALTAFRQAHAEGFAEIRRRFEEEALPGSEVVRAHAFLVEELVRAVFEFVSRSIAKRRYLKKDRLAVVATGGLGRGQMAPYSDVDLMFLHEDALTQTDKRIVERVLHTLWDLGFKVGSATRSIEQAIKLSLSDMTIRTSLLESRWLAGERGFLRTFQKRFRREVVAGSGAAFVQAKLAERAARHKRMGDTRYVLEPNVKDGKGGLRDLHTLYWIAKYLYPVRTGIADLVKEGVLTPADVRTFERAENYLWTVRCNLHYLAGRPEERVTFDAQKVLAMRMGYKDHAGTRGVERVMKHYFLVAKDVGDLTRILCAVIEEQQKGPLPGRGAKAPFSVPAIEGFRFDGGRLTVDEDAFAKDPVKMLRLFHEAHRHGLHIHPRALRLVGPSLRRIDNDLRADPEANRLFLDMLTTQDHPEKVLTALNEAGVFGRFVPDFGRVVAQMQYDMYHVYTVDEHTIRAIGILAAIERGELKDDHPVSSAIIPEVQSRRVLYLAVLLHDVAKGRGGDHSEIGAEIALKLGRRLGFTEWETETVAWLVRYHLLMSRTAFKRDIDDPKTVSDFVAAVQSPERLRLLLILTVVDIRAVGPTVWNSWKANLLRELYYRASALLSGAIPAAQRDRRVEAAKAKLRELLADWDAQAVEDFIAKGRPDYWLGFDTETHVRHACLVRAAEGDGPAVETRVELARGVTEIVVYARDRRGLFASIAGAIALSGASIVDARIVTLADGLALDTFWIQDIEGRPYAAAERLERLTRRIKDALAGTLDTAQALAFHRRRALPSRTQVFTVPPRVLVDNKAASDHTVIEVNGRDRVGFLHDVTATITALGLQISSAHISTYGERVVDVFYVKDAFGLKIEHPEKIKAIRERLLQQVAAGGPEPEKEPAAPVRRPQQRKQGGVLQRILGRSPRAQPGAGR